MLRDQASGNHVRLFHRLPNVFQWYFKNGEEIVEQREGQLLFRCVNTVLNDESDNRTLES
jgi:hypothetical protein